MSNPFVATAERTRPSSYSSARARTKVKRPVVLDFLDLGTTAKREAGCLRELELNRRLAPDVYLGVAHLSDPTGGPDEPILVMRRMPEDTRLSAMVRRGEQVCDVLADVAGLIAEFHSTARRGAEIDRAGEISAVRARWQSTIDESRRYGEVVFPSATLTRIERLAMRYLAGRGPLFDRRIAERRIVDGHGDLLSDDIFCLSDGPRVLDCLDFDDGLRYVDVVDDIAVSRNGPRVPGSHRPGGALPRVLRGRGGTRRTTVPSRPLHRLPRVGSGEGGLCAARPGRTASADDAVSHLAVAVRHLERSAVRVALVSGLPGTGKTTLATALADRVGATVISTDQIRHDRQGDGTLRGAAGVYRSGLYAPAQTATVYEAMLARAQSELDAGGSVILDASWTSADERARALPMAVAADAVPVEICCTTPADLAASRIRERRGSLSDATPEIAAAIAQSADAWPEAPHCDTSVSLDVSVDVAVGGWREAIE